jgi:hypothetical protein
MTRQAGRPPRHRKVLPKAIIAGCLLLCLAGEAAGRQAEARLEREAIQFGELARLVIATDADPGQPPDLSPLAQDFRIVSRQRRSSVSVVSGRRRERHELVLTLSPRRAGLLEVPPIRIGEAATAPLQLAVGDGPQAPADQAQAGPAPRSPQPDFAPPDAQPSGSGVDAPVLVEAWVEPRRVRVAQQAVLVARVLTPGPVSGPGLVDPRVDDATLLPLGEDWDRVRRSNTDYQVYERRYALFPRRAGPLDIEPLVFEGWRQAPLSGGYAARPEGVRAVSAPASLEVLPAAEAPAGTHWLPARSLTMSEIGPDPYQVLVGQTLERVVEIRADGVPAADIPELTLPAPHQLERVRARPVLWDERTPKGVIGTRRETVILSGSEAGSFRLPPLSLDWWDTDTGEWTTARLPGRDLILTAATAGGTATPRLFEPGDTRDTWEGRTSPEESDDRPAVAADSPAGRPDGEAGSPVWAWTTAILAVAWVVTMAFWWGGRRRHPSSARRARRAGEEPGETGPGAEARPAPPDPLSAAVEEVRRAYEGGEAAAARQALLAWAALAMPEEPPGNLALLARRCPEPLRQEILLLEQAFFSPRPLHWERRRVWERLPGFRPLPPEEPASFRRKKPLRRSRPSPDTAA